MNSPEVTTAEISVPSTQSSSPAPVVAIMVNTLGESTSRVGSPTSQNDTQMTTSTTVCTPTANSSAATSMSTSTPSTSTVVTAVSTMTESTSGSSQPSAVTSHVPISFTVRSTNNSSVVCTKVVGNQDYNKLFEKLTSKMPLHPNTTSSMVKSLMKQGKDLEISTTCVTASLTCPISKMRLKTPCRGVNCKHIQCVDGLTFLQLNVYQIKWKCPVCSQPVTFAELIVDGLFKQILKEVSEDVDDVWFDKDGAWHHSQENDADNVCDSTVIEISDLEESIALIDLTGSDDENESTLEKSKASKSDKIEPQKKKVLGDSSVANIPLPNGPPTLSSISRKEKSLLNNPYECHSTGGHYYRRNTRSRTSNAPYSRSRNHNYSTTSQYNQYNQYNRDRNYYNNRDRFCRPDARVYIEQRNNCNSKDGSQCVNYFNFAVIERISW